VVRGSTGCKASLTGEETHEGEGRGYIIIKRKAVPADKMSGEVCVGKFEVHAQAQNRCKG